MSHMNESKQLYKIIISSSYKINYTLIYHFFFLKQCLYSVVQAVLDFKDLLLYLLNFEIKLHYTVFL